MSDSTAEPLMRDRWPGEVQPLSGYSRRARVRRHGPEAASVRLRDEISVKLEGALSAIGSKFYEQWRELTEAEAKQFCSDAEAALSEAAALAFARLDAFAAAIKSMPGSSQTPPGRG